VRKIRWASKGRGKRGGLRVIYYLRLTQGQIWLLTLYGKNVRETIPAHVLRQIKEAIEDG
jgi:mRNA-degrading endonuclease RelE of RelBE toxin-antitoxin system